MKEGVWGNYVLPEGLPEGFNTMKEGVWGNVVPPVVPPEGFNTMKEGVWGSSEAERSSPCIYLFSYSIK